MNLPTDSKVQVYLSSLDLSEYVTAFTHVAHDRFQLLLSLSRPSELWEQLFDMSFRDMRYPKEEFIYPLYIQRDKLQLLLLIRKLEAVNQTLDFRVQEWVNSSGDVYWGLHRHCPLFFHMERESRALAKP